MAQLINTNADYDPDQFGRIGPFRSTGGDFYVVTRRATEFIAVWKSPVGGPASGTWSEQDSSNHPSLAGASDVVDCIDVVQVGDVLHIAFMGDISATLWQLRYATFNMATDAYAIDEAVVDDSSEGAYSTETFTPKRFCRIGMRSDGDTVIVYQGGLEAVKGTDRNRVNYARRESSSWTTGVAVDDGGAVDYSQPVGVMGDNDRFHMFMQVDNGTPNALYQSLDSSNSLDGTSSTSTNIYYTWVGVPIDSNDVVFMMVRPGGFGQAPRLLEADAAGGAFPTARISGFTSWNIYPIVVDEVYAAGLAWDSDDSEIRIVARKDLATDTRRHVTWARTNTWTDVEELNSDESTTSKTGYSVVYDSTGTKLRYVYAQAGDAYYEELSLGGTTYAGSISEGAKGGETFSETAQCHMAEGAKGGETLNSLHTALLSLSEGAKAGDTQSSTVTFAVNLSEGAKAGDTWNVGLRYTVTLTEGAKAGETISSTVTFSSSISEGTKAGETPNVLGTFNISLDEGALGGETFASIATLLNAISEGATAGDLMNAGLLYPGSISEGAEAGDTLSGVVTFLRSFAEGAEAGDAINSALTVIGGLTEGASAGDALSALGVLLGSIAEGSKAGEVLATVVTWANTVNEGAKAGDTQSTIATLLGTIAEGAVAGDTLSGLAVLLGSLADGASAGDTWSGTVTSGGVTYSGTLTDGALAGDTWSALVTWAGSISEGATAGDTQSVYVVRVPVYLTAILTIAAAVTASYSTAASVTATHDTEPATTATPSAEPATTATPATEPAVTTAITTNE